MLWQIPDAALIGGAFYLDSRSKGENTIIPDSITSVVTGGYYDAGDGGGAEFKKVAGPLTDGASFQSEDGAWWQLCSDSINIQMFGAIDGQDGSTNLINAIDFANGRQLGINNDFTIIVNDITFTDKIVNIAAPIGVNAIIKHAPNSSTPAITIEQVSDSVAFKAYNITFDGNRANQVNRTKFFVIDDVDDVLIDSCKFTGSYESAIFGDNNLEFFTVKNCLFEDGAYHGGALNLNAYYVSLTGATSKLITFENNKFIGNNNPPDPGRATGGIIVSFSDYAPCNFIGNYFENLGTYSSGNYVGNIDLYTNGGKSTLINNRAVNAYYTPWKLQNADDLIVAFNRIEGFVIASTVDVGAAILQNARGYPSALSKAVVYGNYVYGSGKEIEAFYFQGNGDYSSDAILMTDNIAENCGRLASLNYITYAELKGNIGDNMVNRASAGVILIANTDAAPGAPNLSTIKINGGRILANTGSCIFARTGVTNLDLTIENVTLSSPSSPIVTFRNGVRIKFNKNHFLNGGITQLDIQNLSFAEISNNTASAVGTLASSGIVSNDYRFNPSWDIQGSAIFNPSLIAPGDMVVTNVTVTGASLLGSIAQASFSLPLAGIVLNCFMSAANTATVQFINPPNNPTGSIDLNSGTITVKALQRV